MHSSPSEVAAVRILLVDDFAPWRHRISSILQEQSNWQVVGHAADGLDAVRKTGELQPDLILLDISIPLLNGIEAAVRIFQSFPGTKIIFLSHHSSPDLVRAALGTGAQGYVLKSDAGSEILLAVQSVLLGGRFLSRRLEGHNPLYPQDN